MENHREDFLYLSKIDNILQLDPFVKKCYFYKFDGYMPDSLHELFSDFLLFPEQSEIQLDRYSDFQKSVYCEDDLKAGPRLVYTTFV